MAATRPVARYLFQQGCQPSKWVQKPFSTSSVAQVRAHVQTVRNNASSPLTISPMRSRTSRICGYRASVGSMQSQRGFSATAKALHGHWEPPEPGEEIYVTFVDKDGDEHKIAVNKGDNLLTVAQGNDIEMEGACEGSCSCSTCHVIVEDEDMFDKIPEATDEENDMLDLAFGLTETSRLGCQIVMSKELDGLRVRLPSMTRNLQASDFSKKN